MAARKTPAQKAAETRKQKQEMSRAKQQVCAIVLFAIGIFLGALSVIEGDNFWRVLHDTLYGLFGFAGILIAPAFIYIAVMATLDKPIGKLGHKVWQSVALIVLVSTAVQIFSYGPLKEQGLWNKIKELFAQGVLLNGGGLVSGLIGQPLVSLCGESGAKVIVVLLIFVFVMIFTGGTLIGLFRGAMKPVQKIGETYTERIQERQSAPDATPPSPGKGRFNVDIPLDGDQPTASRGEPKAAGPFPPAPDVEPSLPWQDAAVPAAAADEGAGAQGSFARKSLERLEQQQEAKATLLGASRPGRFEFDIQLDGDLDDVRTDELPEEPDLEDISQDEVGEDTVLHFRQSAPAAGEDKPQSTDDVINEILRRSANGEEILEGEELPRHGEPEEENAPPEGAKKDPVERKLEAGLSAVSAEVAAKGANERFAEEFGSPKEYAYPPVSLLSEPKRKKDDLDAEELKANAQRLVDTLKSFGVQTRIIDIAKGPAVTRYELQPSAGVKISKITSLADDIALNLASAGVRIEAPIPNKPAVGIEVPNKNVSMVNIREIIDSNEFVDAKSPVTMALGRDLSGRVTVADISKMPHMLIAGATGSGKSVCINSIIISLLYKSSPEEVKLLMVDPKVVELGVYNGIPHLLVPVVTDPKKAAGALAWAVNEMLQRYKMFADNSVRDISGFNRLAQTREELSPMPQIVIIIDELADLMMAAPNEVEDYICRLAQMARAAGMHLVIATQRPSVDVITGVIKANIPSRIAFAVSSSVDSRTILDMGGAEKLLGRGDMLFYPVGAAKPIRVQGCFVSDQEVDKVVGFVKSSGEEHAYDEEVMQEIERQAVSEKSGSSGDGGGFDEEDEMLPAAIECVIEMGQASTSMLQRKLKLGYARAARIIDELEQKGVVGPFEGSKPRQVLITREQWYEMKLNQEE
ncbi:FtsK/SpoIIIE family DNA translocase [Harryflintia acetispora]|uniref:FtsK/SpoIIIE family DNA translocase n=1 Tax=Harryflintia acetispora TaxID=1849041 RepID=UPI002571028F|nr:DNA translocase FtsK [Harryflintia acetispora]